MYSPQTQEHIKRLRDKVQAGTYTKEECIEAVRLLREGRLAAQTSAAARKAKTKAEPIDVAKVLSELDNL
jgi:hypothetical protein